MKKLLLLIFFFSIPTARAEIPQEIAVKCLIGEAGNQGFKGMTAVGEVLRRRNSIKGLYGCKTATYSHSSHKLRSEALKAWKASKTSNLTLKATHFENVEAFGWPSWSRGMTVTTIIKDHYFLK